MLANYHTNMNEKTVYLDSSDEYLYVSYDHYDHNAGSYSAFVVKYDYQSLSVTSAIRYDSGEANKIYPGCSFTNAFGYCVNNVQLDTGEYKAYFYQIQLSDMTVVAK